MNCNIYCKNAILEQITYYTNQLGAPTYANVRYRCGIVPNSWKANHRLLQEVDETEFKNAVCLLKMDGENIEFFENLKFVHISGKKISECEFWELFNEP